MFSIHVIAHAFSRKMFATLGIIFISTKRKWQREQPWIFAILRGGGARKGSVVDPSVARLWTRDNLATTDERWIWIFWVFNDKTLPEVVSSIQYLTATIECAMETASSSPRFQAFEANDPKQGEQWRSVGLWERQARRKSIADAKPRCEMIEIIILLF